MAGLNTSMAHTRVAPVEQNDEDGGDGIDGDGGDGNKIGGGKLFDSIGISLYIL